MKNNFLILILSLIFCGVCFAPQVEIRKAASGGGSSVSGTNYSFNANQFGTVNGTNVSISTGTSITNPVFYASSAILPPLKIFMQSTNGVEFYDVNNNLVGWVTTNGYFRNTNSIFATLQTTDNTTNNIYTFTPRDNSCFRVFAHVIGYNATSSAGYTKVATFKIVSGTVTQIGSTANIGNAEDDSVFESLVDTAANIVRIRVAGNTGKTVNWIVMGDIQYAQ